MGRRNIFMLIGAVIFAALVTLLVASQINKARRAGQDDIVEVAVAKVDLKWGTVLTKEMIDRGKFLKTSLPPQHCTDPTQLYGRVLVVPVGENVPICEKHLAPVTLRTGGVSAVITPEKRAIGVKVDKVIGVSGFIHPNNRVDVLVTVKRLEGYNYNPVTKTILENILVLAVGPDIEPKTKEEKANPVDVITLEVTPEEAEKLSLAAQEGKISLVLRNYGDGQEVLTTGQTLPKILSSYSIGGIAQADVKRPASNPSKSIIAQKKPKSSSVRREEAKKEEQPKAKPVIVELIKGSKMTEVRFEKESSL